MLSTMFSFSGRLKRLPFLGYTVLSSLIGVVAIFVASFMGGIVSAGGGKVAILAGGTLAGFLACIPMLWSSLALTSKRLRDAGFPPAIVIPAVFAFILLDTFVLSKHLGVTTSAGFARYSIAGSLVNVVYGAVLLFWPSRGDADDETTRSSTALSRLDDPDALAAAYRASFAPVPVATAAAPAMPALAIAGGPGGSFGRRRRA